MIDPLAVKIVGRLVEQQNVGLLNERVGQEKSRLLTARNDPTSFSKGAVRFTTSKMSAIRLSRL